MTNAIYDRTGSRERLTVAVTTCVEVWKRREGYSLVTLILWLQQCPSARTNRRWRQNVRIITIPAYIANAMYAFYNLAMLDIEYDNC